LEDKLEQQLKRKAEDDEKKPKAVKRSRKQVLASSAKSTPVLSPSNVDRLFSAGEDIILADDENTSGSSTPSKKSKATRIGRPRTNFSFTG
jgi:DNA helicase INO80